MLVTAFNPETDEYERSFLSNSISSGEINLVVKNNNRFAATNLVLIGEMAREKSEIVSVVSVAGGTVVVVTPTVFPHSADDPVYVIRFDQVRFYRSTTGVNGTYSLISTQALDVDNENSTTVYDDPTGIASYYYRVDYYNSVTTTVSTLSDPVLGSGYARNTVGFITDEILRETGDQNEDFINRTEILGWFNAVNDDLLTRTKRPYRFLHTRQAYSRTANATTLAFPTDMWKFDRLDYVYIDTAGNSTTYPVRAKTLSEFRNTYGDALQGVANDELQFISLDDTVDAFRLYPRSATSATNTFYVYYYKFPTELSSDGDVLETDTPAVYKLYALHRFYLKKSTADPITLSLANTWGTKYEAEVAKLKRGENKDAGTPKGFRQLPQDFKQNRRF